jgi:hypothetical protein
MDRGQFEVSDISCHHCVMTVEPELAGWEGGSRADWMPIQRNSNESHLDFEPNPTLAGADLCYHEGLESVQETRHTGSHRLFRPVIRSSDALKGSSVSGC